MLYIYCPYFVVSSHCSNTVGNKYLNVIFDDFSSHMLCHRHCCSGYCSFGMCVGNKRFGTIDKFFSIGRYNRPEAVRSV